MRLNTVKCRCSTCNVCCDSYLFQYQMRSNRRAPVRQPGVPLFFSFSLSARSVSFSCSMRFSSAALAAACLGFSSGIITESPLNLVRQLDKKYLRNSAMKLDHDAIRLNAADRRVFVFFPGSRLEVLGECE